MEEYESLSHARRECKYHVVFHQLAEQKESRIEEGHLRSDHVHMMIAIPPKYAMSQVIGYFKGKSAVHVARVYGERKRKCVGPHFMDFREPSEVTPGKTTLQLTAAWITGPEVKIRVR